MALLRRACLGWERVAADRARRTTVRAVLTARGRRVCAAVGWGAWGAAAAARHRPLGELLCGGGGGPCRGCMVGLAAVVRRSPHEDDPAGPARTKGQEQRLDVDRGLSAPPLRSLLSRFSSAATTAMATRWGTSLCSCCWRVAGRGWDRQMDRSEMLPMMYDSTLGD
jgi:hypothetical protein